jgi:hypothetical protein
MASEDRTVLTVPGAKVVAPASATQSAAEALAIVGRDPELREAVAGLPSMLSPVGKQIHLSREKLSAGMYEKLPRLLNRRFDDVCRHNGMDPENRELSDIGYHLVQLGLNAVEHARRGTVVIALHEYSALVVARDTGDGFDDPPRAVVCPESGGWELSDLLQWADWLSIESRGLLYGTRGAGEQKELAELGQSAVTEGSRVAFLKRVNMWEMLRASWIRDSKPL